MSVSNPYTNKLIFTTLSEKRRHYHAVECTKEMIMQERQTLLLCRKKLDKVLDGAASPPYCLCKQYGE